MSPWRVLENTGLTNYLSWHTESLCSSIYSFSWHASFQRNTWSSYLPCVYKWDLIVDYFWRKPFKILSFRKGFQIPSWRLLVKLYIYCAIRALCRFQEILRPILLVMGFPPPDLLYLFPCLLGIYGEDYLSKFNQIIGFRALKLLKCLPLSYTTVHIIFYS